MTTTNKGKMMTVSELIEILSKVENKETPVVISIEHGFGEVVQCSNVNSVLGDEFMLFGDEE